MPVSDAPIDAPADPEFARKLFAGNCDCILAAAEPAQFPPTKPNEASFIGRSNAGKSSLINALTGRKNLARASNTPGRTQQIVFFDLGGKLTLADLPGYGHAAAPQAEKDRWNELVRHYLKKRAQLRLVCILIDSRHGLLANDLEMLKFLDRAGVSAQIVLTKADLIHARDLGGRIAQTEAHLAKHPAARAKVIATSAEKGTGIEELRVLLAGLAG